MTLQPSVNLALNFDKAQKKWRFAIFQAHAQSNNVTLSLNARYEFGLTITGLDIALLFPLPIPDISYPFYLRSDNNHSSYRADVIAVPYEDGGESNQDKECYRFVLEQRFPDESNYLCESLHVRACFKLRNCFSRLEHFMKPKVIGLVSTWNSEILFSFPSPCTKQLSFQHLKVFK